MLPIPPRPDAAPIVVSKVFPIHPPHPERICWGCDKYCPANAMACGNGSERTQHPVETFGDDWFEWQPPSPTREASAQSSAREPSVTAPGSTAKAGKTRP